jgi:hypothetical protein
METVMGTSDLPYVQAQDRLERSSPVFPVGIVNWTDRSGTVAEAGVAFELLAEVEADVSNRFIAHVGDEDSGSLWVNWLGGDAEVNGPGSIELIPGDIMPILTRAPVSALGTVVGLPFTAAEG